MFFQNIQFEKKILGLRSSIYLIFLIKFCSFWTFMH